MHSSPLTACTLLNTNCSQKEESILGFRMYCWAAVRASLHTVRMYAQLRYASSWSNHRLAVECNSCPLDGDAGSRFGVKNEGLWLCLESLGKKKQNDKWVRVKERPMVTLTQVVVELEIRQKQQQQLWIVTEIMSLLWLKGFACQLRPVDLQCVLTYIPETCLTGITTLTAEHHSRFCKHKSIACKGQELFVVAHEVLTSMYHWTAIIH